MVFNGRSTIIESSVTVSKPEATSLKVARTQGNVAYDRIKKASQLLGVYRQARWFNRHFLNRQELHQEQADFNFYSKFIHSGELVFDVGANCGTKSRVFLKLGARVVAFEPQADCLRELEARCGRNAKLITVQAALSPTEGKKHFYVRGSMSGMSGFIENWGPPVEAEILVPTYTLDRMISLHGKPQYIKIDAEGYDYEVLKGLSQPVPYISFEYHDDRQDQIEMAINCINYLSSLGELAINITPSENLVFAYPEWLSKEDFLEVFPEEIIQKGYDYRYGDIFVRI
jgi:FkbM family methyltransferase